MNPYQSPGPRPTPTSIFVEHLASLERIPGFRYLADIPISSYKINWDKDGAVSKDIESQSSIRSTLIGKVNLTGDMDKSGSSLLPFRVRNAPKYSHIDTGILNFLKIIQHVEPVLRLLLVEDKVYTREQKRKATIEHNAGQRGRGSPTQRGSCGRDERRPGRAKETSLKSTAQSMKTRNRDEKEKLSKGPASKTYETTETAVTREFSKKSQEDKTSITTRPSVKTHDNQLSAEDNHTSELFSSTLTRSSSINLGQSLHSRAKTKGNNRAQCWPAWPRFADSKRLVWTRRKKAGTSKRNEPEEHSPVDEDAEQRREGEAEQRASRRNWTRLNLWLVVKGRGRKEQEEREEKEGGGGGAGFESRSRQDK
ncbi:hypothetical protein WN48_11374 [Eufriesea mexicana]|uniref:Uncharacterized protein n=1 Tax=Eufriesea mexicana TaxID=516756 RepID=A0A310SQ81_9HYME|nr:hypothetical protein WN48_11374 [Eufriesea mexicana]